MTVEFHSSPSDHDALLGSVLTAARGSAWVIAAAVSVKGLSNHVTPPEVRLWLRTHGIANVPKGWTGAIRERQGFDANSKPVPSESNPNWRSALLAIVDSDGRWRDLVAKAREKVLRATPLTDDDLRALRLDYARCMYGKVLTALPTSKKLQLKAHVNSRVLLAELGMHSLTDPDGRDSVILGMDELAASMGWSHNTALRSRDLLLNLKLMTHPMATDGRRGRYRVRQLSKDSAAEIADLEDSWSSLVDGRADAVASIIGSVSHPLWGYSDTFDHRHWLMLLVDAAGRGPEQFGMNKLTVSRLRQDFSLDTNEPERNHFRIAADNGRLPWFLDQAADDPDYGTLGKDGLILTAREARTLAGERYRTRAQEFWDGKRQRADVLQVLDDLASDLPLPRWDDSDDPEAIEARDREYETWVMTMQAEIVAGQPRSEIRAAATPVLVSRLVDLGFSSGFASSTVSFIMHAPAGANLEQFLAEPNVPAEAATC